MKKNNTILWLLALVGVGAGVYYFTKPKAITEETKNIIGKSVDAQRTSAIDAIRKRQEASLATSLKNIKITG